MKNKYILITVLLMLLIVFVPSLLGTVIKIFLGLVAIGIFVWFSLVIFKWSVLVIFKKPLLIIYTVLDSVIKNSREVSTLSEIKGELGEYYTEQELKRLGMNYRVFNDLYLPNDKGTTQIDHIVTSPFGIFVIETKNYKGWIFGSENERQWTQVIYNRREKLYNPIWQNNGHIVALKTYIGKEDFQHIHSIIAFSPRSTLKFKDSFKTANVIQIPQLVKFIEELKEIKISETELQEINQLLERMIIEDKKEKRQVKKTHIEVIKNIQKEQLIKEKIHSSQNKCSKCGGELSLKTGIYGSFYGCSCPKYRYTRRISSQ